MIMRDDKEIIALANKLLDEACEGSRSRDAEIMQGIDGEKEHAKDVLSWVEKLTDNPSLALKVAALLHDIDRVITPNVGGGFKKDRKSKEYEVHKKNHAKRSVDYISAKFRYNEIEPQFIERVGFLILHHDDLREEIEPFNDKELDVLVAADSFAFFTTVAPKLYKAEGEERIKDKIRFMIKKMSPWAQKLLREHKIENEVFDRLKNDILN